MTSGRTLPLTIDARTATSAVGRGAMAHVAALREGRTGLQRQRFEGFEGWIGAVAGLDAVSLPQELARWDCRNNRLAELALAQDGFIDAVQAAVSRHGPSRVATYMGTSTSGVLHTERAYRERTSSGALPEWYDYRATQSTGSLAEYVHARLGLAGPCATLSAACASSAKVFGAAARAIRAGLCDAAVAGGVDTLCLTTLHGFQALQLVSPDICRPADVARSGLSIGEAGGYALLTRSPARAGIALLGCGESSDAHHMSQPHPAGAGAIAAMRAALSAAGCDARDIDYVNLHGTATPANDAAEDRAVFEVFGGGTACSSTKGWTGHTLGAAGILEAVLSILCIEQGWLPGSLNTRAKDPALRADVLLAARPGPVNRVMSNSFGFGGANCSLLLGRA